METPAPRTSHFALRTTTVLQTVLLAGIFVLNFFMITDPDLWWHLATGRHIVETGSTPRVDPFSYTAAEHPWVTHEWLAEIAMYLLYRFGGYLALVVLFASVTALTFWTVLRTLRFLGLTVAVATCITFWIAIMSMTGWNVRPQAFSYLFFSIYLYILLRSRGRNERRLWLLPVIMVLWVNLHAGYIMGLLLLGFFITGEGINRLREKAQGSGDARTRGRADAENPRSDSATVAAGFTPAPSSWASALLPAGLRAPMKGAATANPFTRHLAVAVATLMATVLNPQGLSMLLYPFTYAGTQNASMKYIFEWQSPNFHDYFLFVFGASIMVLMVAPSRRPMDWALAVPLLALTAMSLQSIRVIPFYALVAAPVLGTRLATRHRAQGTGHKAQGTGDREVAVARDPEPAHHPSPSAQHPSPITQHSAPITHHPSLSTQHSALSTRHSTPWNWVVVLLCLAVLASTLYLSDRVQLGPEPRTDSYPADGAQYIREAGLEGKLFNTYHWGGFLAWTFYPERRVFIDGRADMYGDQFIEEYRKVDDVRPGWSEVLDRYQVGVMLVEKDSRIATLLTASPEWDEVFRGEIEIVFVRAHEIVEHATGERGDFAVQSVQ